MERTYLVVESDPVVAIDLQETVLEHDPQALTVLLANAEDATDHLTAHLAHTATVIAGCSAEDAVNTGLVAAVEASRSRMLLINSDAKSAASAAQKWRHLQAPFTTESLIAALSEFNAAAP